MSKQKRILITSALPYINGVKHLGNLIGSMLPADVYARFQRQRLGNENVLFICATDEHGTPAELAALEEGKNVRDYCNHWYTVQEQLNSDFALSFDYFGRSSSKHNRELTQSFAQRLWEAGYLEERTTRQVYCKADHRFLPDRYVIGFCPHCGYDRARGDQCENCTRVLDPADLVNPRSAISGSPDIEIRESKHLFLRQTRFEGRLRNWIQGKLGEWPHLVSSIALKWLDEGLQDRGITRDLTWGIPVNAQDWGPNRVGRTPDVEQLRNKVFYVWFDAPIEYIAATKEWAEARADEDNRVQGPEYRWLRWWKGDAAGDVTYVQFMGKDNVPFHTVGFPCTILGVNESEPPNARWKLVDQLKGFNWLNYYGGKFSTSQRRGIFMDAALELLPADYWRWYLVANAPEGSDSSFTWEHFQATVNKDLADVLGNFVNRVLKFAGSHFTNAIPAGGGWAAEEYKLASSLARKVAAYSEYVETMQFRRAAGELRSIWALGNEYVNAAAPWTTIKANPAQASVAIQVGINLIRLFALISAPVIPETASRMLAALRLPMTLGWPSTDIEAELRHLKHGQRFDVPNLMFRKIQDAEVDEWIARFGGA